MTHAICVRCGAMKFGCLTHCKTCGRTPRTARQFAYSYFFSDHVHELSQLEDWSRDALESVMALPQLNLEDEIKWTAQFGHGAPQDDETEPDVLSPPAQE